MNKLDKMENKVLMCTVGLPYSGKSTWAKTKGLPIVSPDAIRVAIHGQRFVPSAEPFVWATAQAMAKSLFLAGHDEIILDACNTTATRRAMWLSPEWKTMFKVFGSSAEICMTYADDAKDEEIKPIIEKMMIEFEPLVEHEIEYAGE